MLIKIENNLEFKKKRNYHLITPCCNKSNKDGKFVNFKFFDDNYGYCHSCGKSTLPPTIYKDENGNEYTWNDNLHKYEPIVSQLYHNSIIHCSTKQEIEPKSQKFIPKNIVLSYSQVKPEDNLLQYLRNTYGNTKVDFAKKRYYLGSTKDGGTVFWHINADSKVQKAKVSYYQVNGKRTNKFKVPYKNEDGFYSCLFGEHLINEDKDKTIILVESEKTAIVSSIFLPNFVWISYGGINGLTENKLRNLKGRKILIVPDMSQNAITIMNKKLPHLLDLGIDANIWDMTEGKTDEQLIDEGWYNCDLEDVFRQFAV